MHFATFAAVAAVAPLVSAHGSLSLPKIAGINMRDLKSRDLLANLEARIAEAKIQEKHQALHARQDDRECGAGIGSCAAGMCCSGAGYCGTTDEYCYSPGCNYQYGPGCPENKTPAGESTESIPRPKLGNVEYGGNGIYNCVNPGTVALTYDDGPQTALTSHVMDLFKSYNAKATFFITGNNINKGQIDITESHAADIKRMDAEGHQIASHTWTHLDMSAVSSKDRKDQMIKNEMALRNIVGKIPTYMRPPYSSCTAESGCEKDLADLGYHVTYFNVDTDDYNQDDPSKIQHSKDWFKGNVTAGGATPANNQFMSIGHDIHYQTVYNLTEFMLETVTKLGYKPVTVGECLGDPKENWYRTAGGAGTGSGNTGSPSSPAPSAAPTNSGKVSTDGNCAGTSGQTCLGSTFGNCCSQYGYCGSSAGHCGTGCNTAFGNCGGNGAAASGKPTTTGKPAATQPATPAGKVSTDGSCGGTAGQTCAGSTFGNCCSEHGYCGSTNAYCGTGCNKAFGTCGTSGAASTTAPVTPPRATTAAPKPTSNSPRPGHTFTIPGWGVINW